MNCKSILSVMCAATAVSAALGCVLFGGCSADMVEPLEWRSAVETPVNLPMPLSIDSLYEKSVRKAINKIELPNIFPDEGDELTGIMLENDSIMGGVLRGEVSMDDLVDFIETDSVLQEFIDRYNEREVEGGREKIGPEKIEQIAKEIIDSVEEFKTDIVDDPPNDTLAAIPVSADDLGFFSKIIPKFDPDCKVSLRVVNNSLFEFTLYMLFVERKDLTKFDLIKNMSNADFLDFVKSGEYRTDNWYDPDTVVTNPFFAVGTGDSDSMGLTVHPKSSSELLHLNDDVNDRLKNVLLGKAEDLAWRWVAELESDPDSQEFSDGVTECKNYPDDCSVDFKLVMKMEFDNSFEKLSDL